MAINTKQIEMTVIVVVEEEGRPTEISHGRFTNPRWVRNICKKSAAVIVEEDIVVVGERGDEQIHAAVMIVIAHGDSHAGHLLAIAVIGDTGRNGDLFKRTVAFVAVKIVRVGVVRHEDIGPAVVVKILEDRLEAEIQLTVGYTGLFGDIGESAVAVVVVESVGRAFVAER